jgi:hypothetical protein
MEPQSESPAVQSLKLEKSRQRSQASRGELQKGLEDTFPASDPVSTTHTAVAAGRTDPDAAAAQSEGGTVDGEFPLVDAALNATRQPEDTGDEIGVDPQEIHALRAEVRRLSQSVADITSGTARLAKLEALSARRDVEDWVRRRPFAATAIAAALAFVFGATR